MLEEDIPAMSTDGISSRSQLRSVPPTNKSQARERDRITDTCIRNDSDRHVGYTTKKIFCIHPWGWIVLWKTGSVTSPAGRVAELLCFTLALRPWNAPNNSLDISNLMG